MSDEGKKKKRKILLVVEDTGQYDGDGFVFYMAGDKERLDKGLMEPEKMCPAEFWGMKLFSVCVGALNESNALDDISKEAH